MGQVGSKTPHQLLASFLGRVIYVSLLVIMVLATIFYGGSDPWWKATFSAAIFIAGVLASCERLLSRDRQFVGVRLFLPIVLLVALSLLQTASLSSGSGFGINASFWNAISADPYETRFVALQIAALALLAALLLRYANTERRLRALIHTVIVIALVSAIFGVLRQTMKHGPG